MLENHTKPAPIHAEIALKPRRNLAEWALVIGKHSVAARRRLSAPSAAVGAGSTVAAATAVGKLIADRAKEKSVERVVFDRGGFLYHGRIKALADAAREGGLQF